MDCAKPCTVPHLRNATDGEVILLIRRPRPPVTYKVSMSEQNKPRNLRTALILLSIAAVFFAGVILKHSLFPS